MAGCGGEILVRPVHGGEFYRIARNDSRLTVTCGCGTFATMIAFLSAQSSPHLSGPFGLA
jgi:hypothetical protein